MIIPEPSSLEAAVVKQLKAAGGSYRSKRELRMREVVDAWLRERTTGARIVHELVIGRGEAQTLSDSLLGVFRPYLVELAGIFVAALAAWLFKLIREKLGLDIEARHREAFQTALTQAAGMLISRLGSGAMAVRLPVDSPGIVDGVAYVQQAVPDAVARFGLDPDAIAEKLTAKIGVVAAAATAR